MTLVLYPAIDVRDGRVVRLRQGDYARETRYPDAPFDQAARYAAQGARWLHLVDLDGAREGRYTLLPLLPRLVAAGLRVQTGGGLRDADDVQRLLDAGAARVVVGSVAIRDPDRVASWIARFGAEALVVALDARRDDGGHWRLPVAGWTASTDASLADLARHFEAAGLRHLLSTDIARDGMLSGPGLDLYRDLREACPGLLLQASGGIRDAADLAAVEEIGCAGAVLGRSLLEGGLDLGALRC
jgi:phosphoribosylformimino-5-aminoimidazole carboxamide ribotide isomerase